MRRDEAGRPEGIKIRQGMPAGSGKVDRFTRKDLDKIVSGLRRMAGGPLPRRGPPAPLADEALEYGRIPARVRRWQAPQSAQEIRRTAGV